MTKRDKALPGFHRPFAGVSQRVSVDIDKGTAAPAAASDAESSCPNGGQSGDASREVEPEVSDAALFAAEMMDVSPADRSSPTVAGPGLRRGVSPGRPTAEGRRLGVALDGGLAGQEGEMAFLSSDPQIEGAAPGVNRKRLKRLKRGEFPPEDRLDLHGKTRREAGELIARFVGDSRAAGLRCVLIIHGRGLHSEGRVPVLREALGLWLRGGRAASSVLAYCSARPEDGGRGAVYVLLRR